LLSLFINSVFIAYCCAKAFISYSISETTLKESLRVSFLLLNFIYFFFAVSTELTESVSSLLIFYILAVLFFAFSFRTESMFIWIPWPSPVIILSNSLVGSFRFRDECYLWNKLKLREPCSLDFREEWSFLTEGVWRVFFFSSETVSSFSSLIIIFS